MEQFRVLGLVTVDVQYISQYELAAVLRQEAQNSQLDSTCPVTVDDKYFLIG